MKVLNAMLWFTIDKMPLTHVHPARKPNATVHYQ
jgi:hypothetical protein